MAVCDPHGTPIACSKRRTPTTGAIVYSNEATGLPPTKKALHRFLGGWRQGGRGPCHHPLPSTHERLARPLSKEGAVRRSGGAGLKCRVVVPGHRLPAATRWAGELVGMTM